MKFLQLIRIKFCEIFRGLDPLVFCGICGVVSAGVGYALGTQLFKTLWKIINKNQARMLLEVFKHFKLIMRILENLHSSLHH